MIINSELFCKAYKKLKSSIYYDKTELILRNKIVEFEARYSNNELEDALKTLFKQFKDEHKYKELHKEIMSSIKYHVFPKKLINQDNDTIIFNFSKLTTEIEELQYFIDMDVRGHILGVVWLMLIGCRIDNNVIFKHSYGNRIRKNLFNELSNEPTYSPYLFEPYFQQYEGWRDTGLEKALSHLENQQDVIVMTMDFKRFYYSVNVDKIAFDKILEDAEIDSKDEENKLYIRINDFVCSVISQYSSLFDKGEYNGRNILPIGFLPSNILSNWCLRNFDKAIVDGWNPLYYGRYVDDILIVDKVEHNSALYQKAQKQEIQKNDIVHFLLKQCTKWYGVTEPECMRFAPLRVLPENNVQIYGVNPLYNPIENDSSEIRLQNQKLKIFYFKSGETSALITCFKEEISKNKSEFRFMPEDDAIFSDDDYSEIYNLKNEDTINKFRGINGMTLDRYKLSKFLGKYLRIGSMIHDKAESSFEQDILKIFDYHAIIDHYIQWEKILEILVINERYNAIKQFTERIIEAIKNIQLSNELKTFSSESDIRAALYGTLHSALCRVFSLVYGKVPDETIEYIYENNKGLKLGELLTENVNCKYVFSINKLRLAYNRTKMSDKSVIPIPLEMLDYNKNDEINLTDFQAAYSYFRDTFRFEYAYYPYMVDMYDISVASCLSQIREASPFSEYDNIVNTQNKLYVNMNYRVPEYDLNNTVNIVNFQSKKQGERLHLFEVCVGNTQKNKLKIAIANTRLSHDNFALLIKAKPNRSYQRYCDLSFMVNQAIKENVDMLVMPECYIPFEWLSVLARTCAKNNLAVVTGVEHFLDMKNKKVYNFTAVILPYIEHNHKCAYISFHLKKHYAPIEIHKIRGYRYEEVSGSNYELYKWNNCYFPIYCCYELTSITDRALFQSYADFIVAVEWNRDVKYYSNILESLSRDIHCYCVQVNSSDYGDSRITKPSKSEEKDVIRTMGGSNSTILIGEIDIAKLRDFQIMEYELQKENRSFKITPPEFDKDVVMRKIKDEPIILESKSI